MTSTVSGDISSQGQIDGRPASFRYDGDEGSLSNFGFAYGHDTIPSSEWTDIPVDNIICILGTPYVDTSDKYRLIYVEQQQSAGEDVKNAASITKTLTIKNPPARLVGDFSLPSLKPHLVASDNNAVSPSPNFHIIISTGSGTGLAVASYEQVLQPVLESLYLRKDLDYALHFTTSETSITELAENTILPRANKGLLQNILLLSGDGGILDIVNTLLGAKRSASYTRPTISILPLGTGNALANSSEVLADNTLGIRTWLRGSPKRLPLFRATFSPGSRALFNEAREERPLHLAQDLPIAYGAVVCSWGLHAGLVADSDTAEYRKFGSERFKMAAKEALFPSDGSLPHAYKGDVKTMKPKHEHWETVRQGKHAYVLATLVSNLEKGFTISPAARPVEGKLRVVHFGPMSGEETMGVMGGAYQKGKHVEDDRIGYEEIEKLRIDFHEDDPRWRRVCIDGKIIRVEKGGWVEVQTTTESVVELTVPEHI